MLIMNIYHLTIINNRLLFFNTYRRESEIKHGRLAVSVAHDGGIHETGFLYMLMIVLVYIILKTYYLYLTYIHQYVYVYTDDCCRWYHRC